MGLFRWSLVCTFLSHCAWKGQHTVQLRKKACLLLVNEWKSKSTAAAGEAEVPEFLFLRVSFHSDLQS